MNEPDPFVGRTLAGRYEVLKKLNEGGVGAVYLAIQQPLDRPVALKLLLRRHADDPTAIKRFEKEALSIARLTHPHIVTVHDFGTTGDGDLFLAMEFLRGQSLRDLLDAAGWLPWERALHVVRGVTRALVAAHTQKIVHRDLKPENIMLVESNGDLDFAKVLDFGLARSFGGAESGQKITRHDVIPGTPAYMSPERVNGIADDPRSDLYSLGAVLFELVCGEPPFPGETSVKVILRHVHEPPRRPSTVRADNPIPSFVDELVLSLLDKDPARRPPSATVLLQRLDELIRPAGWLVAAPGDARLSGPAHGDDDDGDVPDLDATAVVATGAVPSLDSEEIRFALAEDEVPVPLTRRKSIAPSAAAIEPVLLTQKKASSTSAPAPSTQPTTAAPHASTEDDEARTEPDLQAPPSLQRRPTEDFMRLSSAEQDAQIAALQEAAAAGIPARIESVSVAAQWLGSARTPRAVGELCVAFLASRFERVVVVDVRNDVPVVLARAGLATGVDLTKAMRDHPGLRAYGAEREAYYGPALDGPDWSRWYSALGGVVPGASFIAGLRSDEALAFVFYADHRENGLRPAVNDTVVLLREAAAALSSLR